MLDNIRKLILGDISSRFIKRLKPVVASIAALEPQMQALSDEDLAGQTVRFRERLAAGEPLDNLIAIGGRT